MVLISALGLGGPGGISRAKHDLETFFCTEGFTALATWQHFCFGDVGYFLAESVGRSIGWVGVVCWFGSRVVVQVAIWSLVVIVDG